MARWLLTILTEELEDTRMTLREGTLTTDRVTDATSSLILFFFFFFLFPFLRFLASIEGSPAVASDRISSLRTEEDSRTRYSRLYVPRIRMRENGRVLEFRREGEERRGKVGINLALIREREERDRGAKMEDRVVGNFMETRGKGRGADICITRVHLHDTGLYASRLSRRLTYTFHVAANCTGRRKDSRASAVPVLRDVPFDNDTAIAIKTK